MRNIGRFGLASIFAVLVVLALAVGATLLGPRLPGRLVPDTGLIRNGTLTVNLLLNSKNDIVVYSMTHREDCNDAEPDEPCSPGQRIGQFIPMETPSDSLPVAVQCTLAAGSPTIGADDDRDPNFGPYNVITYVDADPWKDAPPKALGACPGPLIFILLRNDATPKEIADPALRTIALTAARGIALEAMQLEENEGNNEP